MKKTYHLCLSGGEEIIFRDTEDYHRGFNCFALSLYRTDSIGLAEAIMATHTHQVVQTEHPAFFMADFRKSYSIYFNHKYQREGKLGEDLHFTMEINGYHHLIAALSYTLRNALHHGVAPIPYAYPHCSANAFFRRQMGKFHDEPEIPLKSYYRHVGRRADFPDRYKMSNSGVFLRESVLDVPQVENLFATPRAYNYYMTRKSSEEWENEQMKDGVNLAPVNLTSIENGILLQNPQQMLIYENGKADCRKLSDIDLCTELDELARNRYGRHSVYQMTLREKDEVAEYLYRVRHLSEKQIRRCLVLPKR
ncbi:MAG: hypothetical protein E7111_06300 [Bacteroidales bacterium]|nr:hypothetical protein [Bacteroidales bacterium]